jgi:hypothetical protein
MMCTINVACGLTTQRTFTYSGSSQFAGTRCVRYVLLNMMSPMKSCVSMSGLRMASLRVRPGREEVVSSNSSYMSLRASRRGWLAAPGCRRSISCAMRERRRGFVTVDVSAAETTDHARTTNTNNEKAFKAADSPADRQLPNCPQHLVYHRIVQCSLSARVPKMSSPLPRHQPRRRNPGPAA